MEETKEIKHITQVLEETKRALEENNSLKLKKLSNQIIHSSCVFQHRGYILIAVIVYSLSKLVERKEHLNIKNWNTLLKETKPFLDKATNSIRTGKFEEYQKSLKEIRRIIEHVSKKPYVKEVLAKAAVNKASKLYEHGISLEQTADLLGISQWELSEYVGQTGISDVKYATTINVKERAKMALEFFK